MSIITVGDIAFLPYAGYLDPALPDRVWAMSLTAPGDASGGLNTAQLNLKSAGVSPGNIFSLEQMSFSDSVAAHLEMRMSTAGLQTFPPGFDIPVYVEELQTDEPGTDAFLELSRAKPRLWLGRGADAGTAATLSFSATNVDSNIIQVTLMGYMWEPRAMNAPGGPRRPSSGVFSN